MKKPILLMLIATSYISVAQNFQKVTFEDLNLGTDTFDDGRKFASKKNFFVSGNLNFNNFYDSSFGGYWSMGFAISTKTDSTTSGFTNLYSCIAASGNNNSKTYAVAIPNGIIKQNSFLTGNSGKGMFLNSMYVNNSTYAYRSMQNGDFFAKKFGGQTGNDKDFFLLQIIGFKTENTDSGKIVKTDTVDFYLADYRFDDNNKDYIVRNWTKVNLTSLGRVDSIGFYLTSSDTGQFGMNTPAFFCIDDIEVEYDLTGSISKQNTFSSKVFPNPVKDVLMIETNEKITNSMISDLTGKQYVFDFNNGQIDVSGLSQGIYLLTLQSANGKVVHKFIKQ